MTQALQPPIVRRLRLVLPACALVALAALVLAPLAGTTGISLARVFDPGVPWADNVDAQIFFIARLPRVVVAALVGASLAAAGVVLQALLRNPLATPFTLGVSSGAALGAILALTWQVDVHLLGLSSVPLASFAGAVASIAVVYILSTLRRATLSGTVLLLAGVTLNAFLSALILLVQYLGEAGDAFRTMRWLMGDLDAGSYAPVIAALPLFLIAFGLFATLPRALNLLTLGDDTAAARGLDVRRMQQRCFLSASLATAAAVSLAGPIGFVGIVVPHVVRLVVGADHRLVLPASALLGGAFLIVCDLVARLVMAPVELPVGVVTAMIGGPFFLWLLVRRA